MSLLSRETQNKRSSRLDMTLRHLGVLQKEMQEILFHLFDEPFRRGSIYVFIL